MPMITIADEVAGGPRAPEWTVDGAEETARLDGMVRPHAGSRVTFLQLVPLVGG